MEFFSVLIDLLGNYTFRNVLLGSAFLGLVSGVLSVFTVLKNESLLSEALSHSVLPGIGIAFLLVGYKDIIFLSIGSIIAAFVAVGCIAFILHSSFISKDAAMAIVLSSFFGLGIVLLTVITRSGNSDQAGLESYLIGSAATLLTSEVVLIACMALLILAIIILFYKELTLLCFDRDLTFHLGFAPQKLQWVLLSLIVLTVTVGLKLVGTILMAALLIMPAVSARFWSHSFFGVVLLSAFFGLIAGVCGSLISISSLAFPTGPSIVLALFTIFCFSLLFGTQKGLVQEYFPYSFFSAHK